jgi:hypothetical protein
VLDKPVPIGLALISLGVGVVFWQQYFYVAGAFFSWFLLESLILAQDERWRRA